MRSGLLRKRVTFQRQERIADEGGGGEIIWNDLVEVWGQFTPERGFERLEAGRLQGNMMGTLKVRVSSETEAVTLADRVIIDDTEHQIRGIAQPDQKNRMLEYVVERGAPT